MANQYLSFDSSGANLTASDALNVASIAVAGVTPGNDQYLTTSNVGALSWIAKPTFASNIKALLLFTLPAFNYNANVATTPVSFAAAPAFNSLGGDITYNGVDSILVNTTGVYMVQYSPTVASSNSTVNMRIEIGGIVTNISQINTSSNNCDCVWLGNVTAAQTIVISSQRTSGGTAKNSIGGTTSSPLTVIRLA